MLMNGVIIIGAGLAGLSAAIALAENGRRVRLVSAQPSERAQSVLAAGGFNAAADTMNENDSSELHYEDTMRGGSYLADPNAVDGLTRAAPRLLDELISLGVPFNMRNGRPSLRNFGGQKKKRTAYSKSSTGKMIMTALIDEVRKYEAAGLVKRYPHHEFVRLMIHGGCCEGAVIHDTFGGKSLALCGAVILCCGGMNGLFPGMTTGTTQNSGSVHARVFSQGADMANLEMIQYHPTTVGISGKRCLVSEAARGEGGRLFIKCGGENRYFMEEKYPELKNLMPRDVVSREMYFVRREPGCEGEVYLDMTGLSDDIWNSRLGDLRSELKEQLGIDPAEKPIPVREGIHYFMGGIYVDEAHRTSIKGLYAAGECACQYHGANRLGGNSMLGAVYGGKIAAGTVMNEYADNGEGEYGEAVIDDDFSEPSPVVSGRVGEVLCGALGIVRSEQGLKNGLDELSVIEREYRLNDIERARMLLARAMMLSALERRESRGAHFREDFPVSDEAYRKTLIASVRDGSVALRFEDIPDRRETNGDKA